MLKVSVVIPAYNEEKYIKNCIESLLSQDYEGEYEIIVVDNGSTDRTLEILKNYPIKVIVEPRKGVAFARQTGFTNASGDIILSTDADTIVPKNWIRKYVEEFEKDNELVGVNGLIEFKEIFNFTSLIFKIFTPFILKIEKLIRGNVSFTGANFAVKKDAFLKIGGFNTNFETGEDIDLGNRLKKVGKIKTINNVVITSSRRFKMGFFKSLFIYVLFNYISLILFKRPIMRHLPPIREVKINPIFGFSILGILLIFLSYFELHAQHTKKLLSKNYIFFRLVNKGEVLITFDDGPSPYTKQILDTLDKYNVKAIFFLVGKNIEKYPDAVKEIYKRGHIIGNHSYSHSVLLIFKDYKTIKKEIDSTNKLIENITGFKPYLFRPPYGIYSPVTDSVIRELNMKVILWNVDSEDWKLKNQDEIYFNVIKDLKGGSIILFHERKNTLKVLGKIIREIDKRGLKFASIF
ncbi:MAG: glycosyltransferase [candidate division WOR-3 bacterium]